MKYKFQWFLEILKDNKNKNLIEAINKGFNIIIESYADVREEKTPNIELFNQKANMAAMSIGNNVLNYLNNSKDTYSHLYSEDNEPELDTRYTSQFNQFIEDPKKIPKTNPKDEIEGDLGLTADELYQLNS